MAKIEIMMLQDFSVGSTIKHKLCTELCDFKGNITKMASKTKEKKPKNHYRKRQMSALITHNFNE